MKQKGGMKFERLAELNKFPNYFILNDVKFLGGKHGGKEFKSPNTKPGDVIYISEVRKKGDYFLIKYNIQSYSYSRVMVDGEGRTREEGAQGLLMNGFRNLQGSTSHPVGEGLESKLVFIDKDSDLQLIDNADDIRVLEQNKVGIKVTSPGKYATGIEGAVVDWGAAIAAAKQLGAPKVKREEDGDGFLPLHRADDIQREIDEQLYQIRARAASRAVTDDVPDPARGVKVLALEDDPGDDPGDDPDD